VAFKGAKGWEVREARTALLSSLIYVFSERIYWIKRLCGMEQIGKQGPGSSDNLS
jgi:hypothetical protein